MVFPLLSITDRPDNRLTQARMLALLDAAESAVNLFQSFSGILEEIMKQIVPEIYLDLTVARLTDEQMAIAKRFERVFEFILSETKKAIPIESVKVIVVERAYFNPTKIKANEHSRETMRKVRKARTNKPEGPTTAEAVNLEYELEKLRGPNSRYKD